VRGQGRPSPGGHRGTVTPIAERLFISAKTVDHHVSAILAKLQAPDRATAGRIARLGSQARAT